MGECSNGQGSKTQEEEAFMTLTKLRCFYDCQKQRDTSSNVAEVSYIFFLFTTSTTFGNALSRRQRARPAAKQYE